MAAEYPVVPLGEIAALRSGFAFKSNEWADSGVPVVKIANVKNGRLAMEGCSFVRSEVAAMASDFALKPGDILIAMTGYIGGVALVRAVDLPAVVNQRVGRFAIRDKRRLERGFLFYLLRSPEIRVEIEGLGYGSAQPNVSPSLIHRVGVPLPPLGEQRAITRILGSLDDKIELNRRMNETLEAMTRALFKSWFVDFDPVRAKAAGRDSGLPKPLADLFPARLVPSPLGPIPEGWCVARLDELADIQGGRQLATDECKTAGRFPVFGANGIMGYAENSTHDGFVVAFGRVGAYCGSVHWTYKGAWINNNASSVESTRWPEFILQAMLDADFEGMRTGSAQPFIPNSSLASFPVLCASNKIMDRYCSKVKPLRLRQQAAKGESGTLAALRDALLPKLISGEIRVKDAEVLAESALAASG